MTETLNAKGKPFSWSFSRLKDYETCPLKYAHASFYCTTPFVQNEAAIWGDKVHKAGEMFIKCKGPIDPEALKPVEPYVTAMMRSGHKVTAELAVTLTKDFGQTSWFAKDAWLRIKIDVVVEKKNFEVIFYDWKTGKRISDNEDQLRLAAAVFSLIAPKSQKYFGKYIWTAHQTVTGIRPLTRKDIPAVWEDFLYRVDKVQQAWDRDCFPARRNGLCKNYCSVVGCIHR